MSPVQFLEFLVSITLQAAVIVGVTHLLCRVVETPQQQGRLWNLCDLCLLMVALCGLLLPHPRIAHPWQAASAEIIAPLVVSGMILGKLVTGVWAAGACLSCLLLMREWRRAFRFLKTCRPATAAEVSRVLPPSISDDFERNTSCSRVRLLIGEGIGSPFCCQWHEPLLVIPEFLLEMSPEEIQLVTRHELEHLRSGHPLQLFVHQLVKSLFWFHPAIWWSSRQASLAREYACDEAAVAAHRDVVTYLKVLVAVAERGLNREAEGAALFFGRGASVLALRGRRLLSHLEHGLRTGSVQSRLWPQTVLASLSLAVWCLWAPLDVLASTRTAWSPWPRWSASVLRTFDIPARDYEPYETRTRFHEFLEHRQRP